MNIGETAKRHKDIVGDLLAAHALTGCDTVGAYYGVGKTKAVKVLESGYTFEYVGNPDADMKAVISEATSYIAACYGTAIRPNDSMSDVRYSVWVAKTGRKGASIQPKLQSLPPSSQAFEENVKRAHLQASIWKAALEPDPPVMNACDYGWVRDEHFTSLQWLTVQQERQFAPEEVLKMIQCSCAADQPCSSMRCSCTSAQLGCSIFCKYGVKKDASIQEP